MKKVITIDFDDTLATSEGTGWGGSALIPIQRVIDFVKKKHEEGFELHIVTFRNWRNKQEVERFVQTHQIPIKSIVCTEGQTKSKFIKQLGSLLHIDDDVETLVVAELAGVPGLLVDWNQEEINSTAKLFQKI
jgi:hydroxymethylpyrimidine pyrophosphatase-like HAD family hydrolase